MRKTHPAITRHAAHGFTLLELMTAITVLAVLLAVGVPSFNQIITGNRLSREVNEFITALNFARSEAYKRGMRVSVCASNTDQSACATSAAWPQGWIVFADPQGTGGTIDTDDTILQVWPSTSGSFVFAPNPSTLRNISFLPMSADTAQLEIFKSGCSGNEKRRIVVSGTGRISLSKQACS